MTRNLGIALCLLLLVACGDDDAPGDGGLSDAGGEDATVRDAGDLDANEPDAAMRDASTDAAMRDATILDAGVDSEVRDAGDASIADASPDSTTDAEPDAGALEEITMLSFNIASAFCRDGCFYTNPRPMLRYVAQLIVDEGVDVVGLQEIEVGTARHDSVDMLTFLLAELERRSYPMEGRFERRFDVDGGEFGQAVLSRYPIRGYVATRPPDADLQAVIQEFVVQPGEERVRIFNIHPSPGGRACRTIDPYLIDEYSAHPAQATFLLGDFNARPSTACYGAVTETHIDACLEGGDPSCVRTVDPIVRPDVPNPLRIDYVFHRIPARSSVSFSEAYVLPDINAEQNISDHLPVFATYTVE